MADRNVTPTVGLDSATLLVPLELSGSRWLVGVQSPGEARLSEHKLEAGDVRGLQELIERFARKLRQQGIARVRVVTCYEAGRDGFWLQRMLAAEGIESLVLDAASIEVPRRARKAKTDRLDLKGLLRVLQAIERGETSCKLVRVPAPQEEDARRLGRERGWLIKERIAHVNRIMALCAQEGVWGFKPLRGDRRARCAELRTAAGAALPRHLRAAIERELTRLELLLEQLAAIEAERDAVIEGAAVDDPAVDKIRKLVRLRSIGAETATMLTREAFYRSFANRSQVGAYFGYDGSPWCSGRMRREQGISKAGNPRARTVGIEAAWSWVRYQPDSELSHWFHRRLAGAKGAVKRKLIVALARKLMVALWRYLTIGLVPQGATFKPHTAQA